MNAIDELRAFGDSVDLSETFKFVDENFTDDVVRILITSIYLIFIEFEGICSVLVFIL